MDNITTLLLVAFLCVTIGYIAGALITTLRMEKESPEVTNPAEAVASPDAAPSPAPAVPASQAVPTNPLRRTAPPRVDLASIFREQPGGELRVEVDGKTYRSASELTSTLRRRMLLHANDLQNWLSTEQVAVLADTRVPANGLSPARLDIAPEARPEPARSIVAQIDEILQENLASTPLRDRGIHLTEEPNQGVVVWIGLEHYNGIDTVPDDQIRGVIRDAVREWEARTG